MESQNESAFPQWECVPIWETENFLMFVELR
jgi:hypothetical protein